MIKNERPSWDEYFLKMCETVKLRSEDLFIQHGAVLVDRFNRVIGTGYNGLIPGGTWLYGDYFDNKYQSYINCSLVDLENRDARRKWMLHAERNAMRNCSVDIRLSNPCTMYITARPCFDCMQDMIASGIKRIVHYDVTGTITEDKDTEDIKNLINVSGIIVNPIKINDK